MFASDSPERVGVAYSGGRDSAALLHAARHAAAASGRRIVAMHVHHGLSPHADDWLEHCRRQCDAAMPVPACFVATRLEQDRRAGESIEAWARRGRYAALTAMARTAGVAEVLLAHHRRDQAETLLLQALRGGGIAGLAAMPIDTVREGIRWRRPWLGRTRDDIDRYLVDHGIEHVQDDSNDAPRFDRNRLRLDVWPSLARVFPAAERALASSATWAQEALALADEVAVDDLANVAPAGPFSVDRWLRLSVVRRSNVLRAWCRRVQGVGAPATLVVRLVAELPACRSGRWPGVGGELRLFRGLLSWAPHASAQVIPRERWLSVGTAGRFALPGWRGELVVEPAPPGEAGLPLALLNAVELRSRGGGERFRAGPDRPARDLKRQFQAAGVAPWLRDVPLLHAGGRLVFVPGLGMDGGALRQADDQSPVRLSWSVTAPEPLPPES